MYPTFEDFASIDGPFSLVLQSLDLKNQLVLRLVSKKIKKVTDEATAIARCESAVPAALKTVLVGDSQLSFIYADTVYRSTSPLIPPSRVSTQMILRQANASILKIATVDNHHNVCLSKDGKVYVFGEGFHKVFNPHVFSFFTSSPYCLSLPVKKNSLIVDIIADPHAVLFLYKNGEVYGFGDHLGSQRRSITNLLFMAYCTFFLGLFVCLGLLVYIVVHEYLSSDNSPVDPIVTMAILVVPMLIPATYFAYLRDACVLKRIQTGCAYTIAVSTTNDTYWGDEDPVVGMDLFASAENGEVWGRGPKVIASIKNTFAHRTSFTSWHVPQTIMASQKNKIIQIAMSKSDGGSLATLFLSEDGQIYGCGIDVYRLLGREPEAGKHYATAIPLAFLFQSKAIKIDIAGCITGATGPNLHIFFLCEDGSLHTFGYGVNGQLGCGFGIQTILDKPRRINVSKPITAMSSDSHYTLVLCNDNTVYGFGIHSGQIYWTPQKLCGLPHEIPLHAQTLVKNLFELRNRHISNMKPDNRQEFCNALTELKSRKSLPSMLGGLYKVAQVLLPYYTIKTSKQNCQGNKQPQNCLLSVHTPSKQFVPILFQALETIMQNVKDENRRNFREQSKKLSMIQLTAT